MGVLRWLGMLLTFEVALLAAPPPVVAARPAPCHGRFRITQGVLIAAGEILAVDGAGASLTSGCAAGTARARGRKNGTTTLTVRFPSCTGVAGRVIYQGRIVAACARLEGVLRTPKAKRKHRTVKGQASTCGDGVVDAGNGEACDQADAQSCPGACQGDCTCPSPTTTTTTTLPPPLAAVVLLTASNVIARIDAASPQTVTDVHLVSGLSFGEHLVGIDFRPSTGELMAVGATGAGPMTTLRLHRIDPASGAAVTITSAPFTATNGTRWGMDFNPTVDRIRVVNDADENLRIVPATGGRADAPTNDTDLSPADHVIAVAYDRNVVGVGVTTLYAISQTTSALMTVGGVNSSPSPNGGALLTVGPLGITLSSSADGGFDIFGSPNSALAALTDGSERTALYTINLATGAATEVGPIGDGATAFIGLAIAPGGPSAH